MKFSRTTFFACLSLLLFTGCFIQKQRGEKGQVCKLHQQKMHKTIVRIDYGFFCSPKSSPGRGSAENFPNAKHRKCGGCVVTRYKFSQLYVCSKCNKARKKYSHAHKDDAQICAKY